MLKGGTTGGDILVLDNATGAWSVAWSNPDGNRIHALEVYNGRLYVGNANMAGAGDVYVSDDGVNFVKDLDTDVREAFRLYKYNGSLYMGAGFTNGQAKIWRKNDNVSLRAALKKVLEEQSLYARNYIISALNNSPEVADAEARWIKNQDDIAEALNALYTPVAGQDLANLLRTHVAIAKEIVAAAKAGNNLEVQAGQARWNTNADAIAGYLSALNVHWPADRIKDLLYKHMQYVFAQGASRMSLNWTADINNYDLDRFYMLELADLLTDGVINDSPGN
jgi:hypothetical protein